ncbi:porin [Pandoraea anhela]|uniref:Porin n=1 Tax=Pandoraea anhela TaxID=2508295 RepID=A0A5E4X4H3_9BURK|nr:porin [Pandoraea anhela]VVE31142.1 porin [Pandoraea anhela]
MKVACKSSMYKGMARLMAISAVTGAWSVQGHAQSVELYGILSGGPQYVSNAGGKKLFGVASGGMQLPRWGLRGSEDLGGGTRAIFTLENGFSLTNGSLSAGRMFGRQAFVGLSNTGWGTVTLGRQYDEMSQMLAWSESGNLFAGFGTRIGDADNIYNTQRFNNAVRYASPVIGGLNFAASYAFSNSTGFSNNNAYSAGVNYVVNGLKLGVAFSEFNRRSNAQPANLTNGAVDDSAYGFSSPFTVSRANPSAGTSVQRILGAGANYDFGFVNATLGYSNILFNYSDGTGLRLQNTELALSRRITPQLLLGTAYIYTWGQYADGTRPKYHQVNLSAIYSLSKRTDLFVVGIYQRAAGDAKFAQIYSTIASSTATQMLYQVGIRHRF